MHLAEGNKGEARWRTRRARSRKGLEVRSLQAGRGVNAKTRWVFHSSWVCLINSSCQTCGWTTCRNLLMTKKYLQWRQLLFTHAHIAPRHDYIPIISVANTLQKKTTSHVKRIYLFTNAFTLYICWLAKSSNSLQLPLYN